jgi:hypothetical protein
VLVAHAGAILIFCTRQNPISGFSNNYILFTAFSLDNQSFIPQNYFTTDKLKGIYFILKKQNRINNQALQKPLGNICPVAFLFTLFQP